MSKTSKRGDSLEVWLKDGNVDVYNSSDYDDYYYDGKVFAVIKDKRWIGIYSIGCMQRALVKGAQDDSCSSTDDTFLW